MARKLARDFLAAGLYSVAATDLHSPNGASEWVEKAMTELRTLAGPAGFDGLMRVQPGHVLAGRPLESHEGVR